MSSRVRLADFRERARHWFGFLATDLGFVGPEVHESGVFYHGSEVSLDVILDERERYVLTFVCRNIGETYVRAELSCLFVECGLGPAQRIGQAALTRHSLEKSLREQAEATQTVLDRLKGAPDRDELLRKCYGR
ncbi:hypothetical protein [Flindersiella endophytica]